MTAPPRLPAGATDLGGGFAIEERAGEVPAVRIPQLELAGVLALMSTAAFNARSDEAAERWAREAGAPEAARFVWVHQVHGTRVVEAASAAGAVEADGLWSQASGIALAVRAADCAPVWLADRQSPRFALLHAGWRGVAAGIVDAGVAQLRKHGSAPADLIAAVGPHLRPCCFEVGPEVAQQFARWPEALLPPQTLEVEPKRRDSVALDLNCVIVAHLRAAGVSEERTLSATACTRCNDHLFHSYRRNGAGGPLMAAVAVRAS